MLTFPRTFLKKRQYRHTLENMVRFVLDHQDQVSITIKGVVIFLLGESLAFNL